MPVKQVSATAKTLLDWGDWIIAWVKYSAPNGSGNNHIAHDGPCASSHYTRQVLDGDKTMAKDGTGATVSNTWNRPMRRAAAVLAYGGGNCQDLAALAYLYCRDYFSIHATIRYVVNRNFGHAYVIVDASGISFVVDPWPLHAQAVLTEDHFCGLDFQETHKNKTGLRSDMNELTKPSRLQIAYQRSGTVSWTPNVSAECTRQYTHMYCGKGSEWYSYYV